MNIRLRCVREYNQNKKVRHYNMNNLQLYEMHIKMQFPHLPLLRYFPRRNQSQLLYMDFRMPDILEAFVLWLVYFYTLSVYQLHERFENGCYIMSTNSLLQPVAMRGLRNYKKDLCEVHMFARLLLQLVIRLQPKFFHLRNVYLRTDLFELLEILVLLRGL